jgi:ABC-type bacteriocin/lantibiotic exporter with double-glycine peptidase domain
MRKVHIVRSAAALATLVLLATGCYTGSARDFQPYLLRDEKGWIFVDGVQPLKQRGKTDCGPVALTMLLRYWGVETTPKKVRGDQKPGVVSAGYLRKVARDAGLEAFLIRGEIADLERELKRKRPVLVGVVKPHLTKGLSHFEVVVAINPSQQRVVTIDPAHGWRQNGYTGFLEEWNYAKRLSLIVFREAPPKSAPAPISMRRQKERSTKPCCGSSQR